MSEYLKGISSPADLKKLPVKAMGPLAAEIRSFLVENVTKTGGHLASNLGIVELTLALERNLDLPKDHLIFDVGHQCYVHKLLTGRREQFSDLRKIGGLSGFPKREESVYDCFGTGHSSTSLSAAIGFAEAEKRKGSGAYTVAVIGDGAFTGGMIHEALNNCLKDLRLIIVLNENEMSISKNIGSFAEALAKIRTSEQYYKTKNTTAQVIKKIPVVGEPAFLGIRKVKQTVKNAIYGSNYFESLGLYYLGPADGNDYEKTEVLVKEAMAYGKSCVIHVKTKKGMGYVPAMKEPSRFHSVPPASKRKTNGVTYSAFMGETLRTLADKDKKICAVTAAMSEGTGLELFRTAHPDRFFDVGIAEEHALTFSAGLAANGMKPFFAVYSSFLQRGYDNLIHDIALQRLPVTVCIDRAGLNGSDGPTHHGVFDVSFLSAIPGFTLFSPVTYRGLKNALTIASGSSAPCAIRYPNGTEPEGIEERFGKTDAALSPRADFQPGEAKAVIFITYGRIVTEVMKAEEKIGESAGTVLLEKLMPYSETAGKLAPYLKGCKKVIFVEEGVLSGGAGMNLGSCLSLGKRYRVLAPADPFRPVRSSDSVFDAYGIGTDDIVSFVSKK